MDDRYVGVIGPLRSFEQYASEHFRQLTEGDDFEAIDRSKYRLNGKVYVSIFSLNRIRGLRLSEFFLTHDFNCVSEATEIIQYARMQVERFKS